MKKVLLIILIILSITNIKAYENEYFKIDIPDDYTEEIIENKLYKWSKDNNYISITINDNKKSKNNIRAFSKEDIQNQKEYIESSINKGLSKYEINTSISNIKKINNDGIYYLEFDIFYPTNDLIGYDKYQKGRMYTTKNYITIIIYNSNNPIEEDETYYDMINSFKILDDHFKTSDFIIYIFIGIILMILLFGSSYIKLNKKRK